MLWAIHLGRWYRMGLNLHVNRLDDFDAYDEIKLLQIKNFRFKKVLVSPLHIFLFASVFLYVFHGSLS